MADPQPTPAEMPSAPEWNLLANQMRGLDTRVEGLDKIQGPDDDKWAPPTTLPEASDYLDRVEIRLEEIAKIVEKTLKGPYPMGAPIPPLIEAAKEVSSLASDAAARAKKYAKKINHAGASMFDDLEKRMEPLAGAFGMGAAVVVLVVALLLLRSSGR